ncbi:SEC-C metal-binding domain-containing protein [Halobacillus sp. SY10]|uniref:SEC-C metal-binding domain-containing protein n=1 Tax=Halobacillus sp. SY10 TaxID=3381356 RepID=UPI00387970D4
MNKSQLLKNLKESQKREKERQRMQEQKFWNHPSDLDDLEGVLEQRTKTELDEIRKNFGFKGLSSLNKADLIAHFKELLPVHLHRTLSYMNEGGYELVKKLAAGEAHVSGKDVPFSTARKMVERGWVFPARNDGKRVWVFPKELRSAFREADGQKLQQQVRENTEWIRLTKGMLHYYGYITDGAVISALERLSGREVDIQRYFEVMRLCSYYEVSTISGGFFHAGLDFEEKKELMTQHESRPEIPYYPFSKEQLLRAGATDPSEAMQPFMELIRNSYDLDEEEILDQAYMFGELLKEGVDINELLEEFQEAFEIPNRQVMQQVADTFVYANNHTRMWMLKGHKPVELSRHKQASSEVETSEKVVPFKQERKIGRNEPCPCGSGKKYKKCCGSLK